MSQLRKSESHTVLFGWKPEFDLMRDLSEVAECMRSTEKYSHQMDAESLSHSLLCMASDNSKEFFQSPPHTDCVKY